MDTGNSVHGLIAKSCGGAGSLWWLAGFTLMCWHERLRLVLWCDRQPERAFYAIQVSKHVLKGEHAMLVA